MIIAQNGHHAHVLEHLQKAPPARGGKFYAVEDFLESHTGVPHSARKTHKDTDNFLLSR
jgi:hypothetical protein